MESVSNDDAPRFRLLDGMIVVAACALAAAWIRPVWPSLQADVPATWLPSVVLSVAAAAVVSSVGLVLHHRLVVGDRRHLGFGGFFGLGFPTVLVGVVGLSWLLPTLLWPILCVGLVLIGFLVLGAVGVLLIGLISPTFGSHLDWLDRYGLAACVLGGIGVWAALSNMTFV